ncbi:MAG: class I SAM-dependent methyltransferase [Parvularculaceae bacterium]
MANFITTGAKRAAYSTAQAARIGWYSMHYIAGRHLVGPLTKPGEAPYASKSGSADLGVLRKSYHELFRREWQHIKNGAYKLPYELRRLPNPINLFKTSRAYLADTKTVARRGYAEKGHAQVLEVAGAKAKETYPSYYLQNFHFQSDGWLSAQSAEIYDMQVETLFTGAGDTMRRQVLPFIHNELTARAANGQATKDVQFVDLACGTGRLLSYVKDNWSDLPATAIDLSPDYLAQARKRLKRLLASQGGGVTYLNAMAEKLPLADKSVDILMSVYLFHELPPKVRRSVAQEIARVLKPGGLYIHADTLQYGDASGLDILLENFPRGLHEPYFDSYCKEDLAVLFGDEGLKPEAEQWGFLTKVNAMRRS